MQRNDRWPDDYDPGTPRSRPGSRRNSGSNSRKNSLKKEKEKEKASPVSSSPNSNNSTPKKVHKAVNLDFVITGKQIPKRYDRANSLPGAYHRRPSNEGLAKAKRSEAVRRSPAPATASHASRSRETSIDDDMSLDLSQVSDFEDTNSKYGVNPRVTLATSTPKSVKSSAKLRSGSLQAHISRIESSRSVQKSRDHTFSREDSLYRTSSFASNCNKYSTTSLEYSSVSPEYSGQSSAEPSPRQSRLADMMSPNTGLQSSTCNSSWQDCSAADTVEPRGSDGEWSSFWANYNNSVSNVPVKGYYDQCPTPYRTENIDLADLDFSNEGSRKRSPENIQNINQIIRNEGLHLTPRETQNIIKCAHILGSVLTKAIERRAREKEDFKIEEVPKEPPVPEIEIKKKTLTLNLKETNLPLTVQEEKRSETVTTQTDISLPNTKSAPKIFENILRQLSKSSIDEGVLMKANKEVKDEKEVINENKQDCDIAKS